MPKIIKKTPSTKPTSKKATTKKVVKKPVSKKGPLKTLAPKKATIKKAVKTAPVKKAVKKTPVNKDVKKTVVKKLSSNKTRTKKIAKTVEVSAYKAKKNEKYMSAAMKKHFMQVLIEWREHLKDEMQKTFDHLKNKGETFADPIDRASQEEEFAFELRTRDRERKLINKIAISLEQIKQDDYGYCHACGIEIGVQRLEARPTATHCIDCKTLDEIKEKQFGW